MRCYFYTIIDPTRKGNIGGGETTNKYIIQHLENMGFVVQIITPQTPFLDPDKAELNVYADIFNDPMGKNGWFTGTQYLSLLRTERPFLLSECAYTACTTLPYGFPFEKETTSLSRFSRQFMRRAKRVVLSSPLHKDGVEAFIQYELSNLYLYLREVDCNHFYDRKIERNINYLYVGAINGPKGVDEVMKKFGNDGLVIAGSGSLRITDNTQYLGYVDPKVLPILYSRTKNFVHLPKWKEPFGRTCAEAALCGCNLITNDNVGAMSWGKNLADPNIYAESGQAFEEMIKEVINENCPHS